MSNQILNEDKKVDSIRLQQRRVDSTSQRAGSERSGGVGRRRLVTKFIRWAAIGLLLILILAAGGIVAYTRFKTAPPQPEALAALMSTAAVEVNTDHWLTFTPQAETPTTGFIFYPGALVDPRAYAPPAQAIATQGYLVVIVPMPLNLAIFDSGKATAVMEAFPDIDAWAIGGHSLGGTMAARYLAENRDVLAGLALWASYPADTNDLSKHNLLATSIYGTRDGLVTPADIEASRALLPVETEFVAIMGGNHAQFGWYGPQAGDLPAALSPADQQAKIVAATVALLEQLE